MRPALPLSPTLATVLATRRAAVAMLPAIAPRRRPLPPPRAAPPTPRPPRPESALKNDKARGQAGFEKQQGNVEHPKDAAKSNRTKDQQEAIVALLRTRPQTTFQLRERAGAMQAPTRISKLRKLSYRLYTEEVIAADENGLLHERVDRYHFLGQPEVAK